MSDRAHEAAKPNRLDAETSPYLRQHRLNPVDWYPWGAEAFERARAEDRPVLLSVGYSACHWCHVMERESFEDPATARQMNEGFVNVKVDREERPDVDSVYMAAVQAMTGHGGWPMTVFLTPAGEPFFGGTYYPPEPRRGMPSFRQVLAAIAQAWATRRAEVDRSAGDLRRMLEQHTGIRAPAGVLSQDVLDRAYRALAQRFDAERGGFGGAPKFPQPLALELALRHHARTGDAEALEIVRTTLHRMADGGIHDQIGGGFHRYSVDAEWLAPHFEKMLYDNALLAQCYLHGWQATGEPRFREVAERTLDYVLREMTGPDGGFHSAQDADSEGVEGKFFVWTPDEVDAVLGAEDGPLVRAYLDVTPAGNWEGDHHHPPERPISIPRVTRPLEEVAAELGVPADRLAEAVRRGRERLYEHRSTRVAPALDDKVLTSWNAMMLRAFAEAARVLERDDYREAAVRNAEFLLRELRVVGRLMRTWKDGRASIGAFLEDHALLADALLAVYEATGEVRWVAEARALADTLIQRFHAPDEGVFYDAAHDADPLVVRPRDLYDNPTPSGSSAATMALVRLARLLGEPRYERIAAGALEWTGRMLTDAPAGFAHMLAALDMHLATPREVVVVGDPEADVTRAMRRVLAGRYLPNTALAFAAPDGVAEAAETVPLLEGRSAVDGMATAYVCERFTCRMPLTDPVILEAELG
jgi:uncharacterized protein